MLVTGWDASGGGDGGREAGLGCRSGMGGGRRTVKVFDAATWPMESRMVEVPWMDGVVEE